MKVSVIFFIFLFSYFSAKGQKNILTQKMLNRETMYFLSDSILSTINDTDGITDVKILKNDGKIHPEVYRLSIKYPHLDNIGDGDYLRDYFPIVAENFPNLQELSVSGLYLHFPVEICNFKKIQILKLETAPWSMDRMDGIITFPNEFYELDNLKSISISAACIPYISEKISNLNKLEYLDIYCDHGPLFFPLSLAFNHLSHCEISSPCELKRYGFVRHNLLFSQSLCYDYDRSIGSEFVHYYKKTFKSILTKDVDYKYNDGKCAIKGKVDIENKLIDSWKIYYENGVLKEERYYDHNSEVGSWFVYDSLGNKLSNFVFNGDSLTITSFYVSGEIAKTAYFKNMKAIGVWKKNDIKGNLQTEYTFVNDVLNGEAKEAFYDINLGSKIDGYITVNYVNGKKEGDEVWKLLDGTIYKIIHYSNGIPQVQK